MNGRKSRLELLENRQLLAADVVPGDLIRDHLPGASPDQAEVKIVGGAVTNDTWPMMVSLSDRSGHFCGGTLIAPEVVVTAAHCVDGVTASSTRAVLGRNDLRTNVGESIRASKIVSHPDYRRDTNASDIAVVLLTSPSQFSPVDIVHSVQTDLTKAGTTATALGWGALDDSFDPEYPDKLHRVDVPIVANSVANRPNAYAGQVLPSMLAAGAPGKDTCSGDSGGPLLVKNEQGEYLLAGITSWGQGCGVVNFPGIYTRVSSFEDWLAPYVLPATAGRLTFDASTYEANGAATISLRDDDLIGQATQDVVVTSTTGDTETLTLSVTEPGSFSGSIQLQQNAIFEAGNETLEVEDGAVIEATYEDASFLDGQPKNVVARATIFVDDHGDSADSATPLTLALSMNGEIESAGDRDWFSLDVTAGTRYEIFTVLRGLDDSVLRVFNEAGELITENDDSGSTTASKVIWQAPEDGRLFIEVAPFEESDTGRYLLRAVESTITDDHADGPIGSSAATIGLNQGEIEYSGDRDWFQFYAVEGVRYTIATQLRGLIDSYLRVIDSDGITELSANDDINNSLASRIVWTAPSDGVRYFEVSGIGDDTGAYNVNFTASIPQDKFEPNNSRESATELPNGETSEFDLNIHTINDQDWFRWSPSDAGVYTIRLDLDNRLGQANLLVYDADGNLLGQSLSDNAGHLVTLETSPEQPLFIEVNGAGGTTARYGIHVTSGRPPLLGDLTQDGKLRIDDVDTICSAIRHGETDKAFDLTDDGSVNSSDLDRLLELLDTVYGDVNLDGLFNSSDLVAVFTSAEYEDNVAGNSNWSTGDWNCDGDFDSGDLVTVFQRATYTAESQQRPNIPNGIFGDDLRNDQDDRRNARRK